MKRHKLSSFNVVLYNGFEYHFEMIGYILDYCNNHLQIEPDVITQSSQLSTWPKLYQQFFQFRLVADTEPGQVILKEEVRQQHYDLVFLLTDDDLTFTTAKHMKVFGSRVICIDHYMYIRRHSARHHVGTRRFPDRTKHTLWAGQCYPIVQSVHEKQAKLKAQKRVQVVCVGRNCSPTSVPELEKLPGFTDMDFHLIRHGIRLKDDDAGKYSNIHLYPALATTEMIQLLCQSHFVYCSHDNADHARVSGSGSVGLAMSTLCTLLVPKDWIDGYGFKTARAIEQFNPAMPVNLQRVLQERQEWIIHRNETFDSIVKQIIV